MTEATTEEYAAEIISLAEALTIFRRSDTATLGLPGGPATTPASASAVGTPSAALDTPAEKGTLP